VSSTLDRGQMRPSETEIAGAATVHRSLQLLQGGQCEAFEHEFARQVEAKYAVACSSHATALHLAYMACLKPGDEVLLPSLSFASTAVLAVMTGANPVFCDIDPSTFLIDTVDAEKRVTQKTRAIVAVHLFGNVCDVDRIQQIGEKYDLTVIWDAVQAQGGTFRGRDLGMFGDLVCYSLYPSKSTLVGRGGIVCTPHREYDRRLRSLRAHRPTGDSFPPMIPSDYRMANLEASIGRHRVKHLREMLALRRRNAAILDSAVSVIPGIRAQETTPGTGHAWHYYSVLVDPERFGCDRDELARRLKAQGIMTGAYYLRGIHQHPAFKQLFDTAYLPRTEAIANRILALPVHHGLTQNEMHEIVKAMQRSYFGAPRYRAAGERGTRSQ
jgi:perosamine synthetase